MKTEIQKHIIHYIFLIVILFCGFGSFWIAGFDRLLQQRIAVLICFSYFSWGMIHHYLKDDLHPKIVVEYLLISALVLLVLNTVIGRV